MKALRGRELRNQFWLRGLDSNQDSGIQSPEAYQLADPGAVSC